MVRILLHGCNGHMGRVVSDLARGEQDLKIVCGVDINTEQHYDFPVFGTMKEAAGTAVDSPRSRGSRRSSAPRR